jgi:Mce-associated membrane protein
MTMHAMQTTRPEPVTASADPEVAGDRSGRPDGAGAPLVSSRVRRAWRLVDAALVVLVLAALVAVGLSARGVLADRADDAARADALAAARQLAVSFTSLDYRTYDQGARRLAESAAGQLRQQLTDSTGALRKAMTTNRSVSHGTVLDAAVVDGDRDSARVLLVVDADVTNTSSTTPTARHYRIQLDLTRQGDRWLGTNLTFVG